MTALWDTRRQSLEWLDTSLAAQRDHVDSGFSLLDDLITAINEVGESETPSDSRLHARVAGVTAIKGRNLVIGIYSLSLDGLGQEGGAVLRPLVEAIECLAYFRLVPDGVERAVSERLPTAGERAKKISGTLQGLREQLNTHASHISYTEQSMRHIFDHQTGVVRLSQPPSQFTLERNLAILAIFLLALTGECLRTAQQLSIPESQSLCERFDAWRRQVPVLLPLKPCSPEPLDEDA